MTTVAAVCADTVYITLMTVRSKHNILYLCPLGKQQRAWRQAAAPDAYAVRMFRNTEVTRADLLLAIADADALITERAGVIDRELIAAGKKLKIIQRVGSLVHDIDLLAAQERGIPVCAQPMVGVIAVAEQVMLQILMLLRAGMPLQATVNQSPASFGVASRRTTEDVFSFNWSGTQRVAHLRAKTVGILGFGEIAAELARLLQPWRTRTLYSKRQRYPESVEQDLAIAYRSPEALIAESDIVVSLLPYSEEMDTWLNAERIATMKRGAYLCHAGSGSVIDEAAVADAIRSGQLAGCAFDTYEWEPIPVDNALLTLAREDSAANIFLTPHIGSCGDSTLSGYGQFYANTVNALLGKPIEGVVAPPR